MACFCTTFVPDLSVPFTSVQMISERPSWFVRKSRIWTYGYTLCMACVLFSSSQLSRMLPKQLFRICHHIAGPTRIPCQENLRFDKDRHTAHRPTFVWFESMTSIKCKLPRLPLISKSQVSWLEIYLHMVFCVCIKLGGLCKFHRSIEQLLAGFEC